MALKRANFIVEPRNPLEWERFFESIGVEPDEDTVTAETIQDNAIAAVALQADAVTTSKIEDNAVELEKIAQLTANRIVGRTTTNGNAQELTPQEVQDLIFTQQGNIGNASTAHVLNGTFDDAEVEAALNALGTKINAILAALDTLGLTA
ncbi:MAG: hypothetical protein GY927_10950 [bacterium]|nr:hypothetical protein [bacterium]